MKANTLQVRVKAKAQNAILAHLVDEEGSVEKAASKLGVCTGTFSSWLNLRSTPWGKHGTSCLRMNHERAASLVLKLEKLTGKSICEIFPISKKQMEPLAAAREYERTVEVTALENYAREQAARIEENVNNGQHNLEIAEAKTAIADALETLNHRERETIRLRYGLADGYTYTLEEVGKILKVTRERIRQTEVKAIRKLQRKCKLIPFRDL